MFKKNLRNIGILVCIFLTLAVAGCSKNDANKGSSEGNLENNKEKSLAEELDYKITGIDAGAGIMEATEKCIEDYGLDFKAQTSSGAVMTQALGDAIENKKPIIVTAWTPHWKFAKYDLKYLEDPKGSFGGEEKIHTIANSKLKEKNPEAYKILDQFYWKAEDMESVMLEINDGKDIDKAVSDWVNNNKDKVSEWTKGVEKVDGKKVKLAYVAWDSEIASTNVIGKVLEDMGHDVTLTQVEVGPMWASVATGDSDAIVAAWLPGTHKKYMIDYKDQIEDLGPNLEGAKIGLAVPTYVEINSIEDLK
ncbi:glycine betaine ABC transporter substrate-binding protein OpuAC [Gottschalkia acidurici 9a]|uniref:Glycine betaine ABC transporter substrate-binding protein OpuAC n=1 Tax=Gottschalkia acidurici (strain ATCC 7906 / DSM 604 / BCRC 14475 / CIP 104303 / KCTC 5404 / NCIMB 10678 / 9a) TaxID=1128398 RepID=K0AXW3_GOTA9|nr:glycine betaine ABC transporter substrate-binding protein [Gottschalkia acidurici]AFS78034.1 glycine betaine ABC transporter substrate-binding protein OpuAC [Gottschalkia acidurici 9a]